MPGQACVVVTLPGEKEPGSKTHLVIVKPSGLWSGQIVGLRGYSPGTIRIQSAQTGAQQQPHRKLTKTPGFALDPQAPVPLGKDTDMSATHDLVCEGGRFELVIPHGVDLSILVSTEDGDEWSVRLPPFQPGETRTNTKLRVDSDSFIRGVVLDSDGTPIQGAAVIGLSHWANGTKDMGPLVPGSPFQSRSNPNQDSRWPHNWVGTGEREKTYRNRTVTDANGRFVLRAHKRVASVPLAVIYDPDKRPLDHAISGEVVQQHFPKVRLGQGPVELSMDAGAKPTAIALTHPSGEAVESFQATLMPLELKIGLHAFRPLTDKDRHGDPNPDETWEEAYERRSTIGSSNNRIVSREADADLNINGPAFQPRYIYDLSSIEGLAAIPNLPPGKWRMVVEVPDYSRQVLPVFTTPRTEPLRMQLAASASITAVCRNWKGEPMRELAVKLSGSKRKSGLDFDFQKKSGLWTTTNANGVASWTTLPPGPYKVSISSMFPAQEVALSPGEPAQLEFIGLQPGSVEATLDWSMGSFPVQLQVFGTQRRTRLPWGAMTAISPIMEFGTFTFEGLAPGSYELRAKLHQDPSSNNLMPPVSFEIKPGEITKLSIGPKHPYTVLSGKVTINGQGVDFGNLHVFSEDPKKRPRVAPIERDGTYRLLLLEPGKKTLAVSGGKFDPKDPMYAAQGLNVKAQEKRYSLGVIKQDVLAGANTNADLNFANSPVRVELTDPEGNPQDLSALQSSTYFFLAQGMANFTNLTIQGTIQGDSIYFQGVPPGKYFLNHYPWAEGFDMELKKDHAIHVPANSGTVWATWPVLPAKTPTTR